MRGGVRAAGRSGVAWGVAMVAAAAAEAAAAEAAAAAGRAAAPALLALRLLRCCSAPVPERLSHLRFHFSLVRSPNAVPVRRTKREGGE